ncbi:hypothetical protein M8J77_017865 [Diaphorina citri]|nr:hypothetical protein M8J77_017865 [Diaphorina citri]
MPQADRSYRTSSKSSGGGVLLAIENSFPAQEIPLQTDNVEQPNIENVVHGIDNVTISEYQVLKKLRSLDSFKGMGPDGIPPFFLKKCCDTLAKPLSLIFRQSLNKGSHLGPILFLLFVNDVSACLSQFDVEFLLFCDDFKLFRGIDSTADHVKLQEALTALCDWFGLNQLSVNPTKCNVITFTRSSNPKTFCYTIGQTQVTRCSTVRDLGVLFDCQMSFIPHINMITSKASKVLGYVFRTCKDLPHVLSFKILFCSLGRGILEFASPIWNPSYSCHIQSLERIQHKALKMMAKKMRTPDLSYPALESSLKLLPLSDRRTMFDLISLHKILNGSFNSPVLNDSIIPNNPLYPTRNSIPFYPSFARSNYVQNSPLIRFQRTANLMSSEIDVRITIAGIKSHFLSRLHTP